MLPLIVIGATDAMRTALAPYAQVGHIEHHPTAEVAYFALLDALVQLHQHDDHPALTLTEAGWSVHVAYGPLAYGALIAHPSPVGRMPHTGHTLALGWQIDPAPSRPSRVMDGAEIDLDRDTLVWQAATAASADQVVDLATDAGLPFLIKYLEWKSPVSET
jgi:hypothetical protein